MSRIRDLRDLKNEEMFHFPSWLKYFFIIAFLLLFAYLVFSNMVFVKSFVIGYGLLGLFVGSIIANATVLFPVPVVDVVFLALAGDSTSIFEAIFLGFVVGSGAAIGEMSAYLAGLFGIQAAERVKKAEFDKMKIIREKISKFGGYFIFFSALVPFPFDIIGITAGLIKFDYRRFFVAALAGKLARYVILSLASFYGIHTIKSFFGIA
jgi:membrane protein YqaA with SNARE-associated domain